MLNMKVLDIIFKFQFLRPVREHGAIANDWEY